MSLKDPEARKEYHRNYHREWYRKNSEVRKNLVRKNVARLRALISEYKLSIGCVDCGYREYAVALDFDHLHDKKINVSSTPGLGWSWKKIQEEIAKCEVVCANCHRVRTSKRLSK